MTHVRQDTSSSCGLACVAMLAGVPVSKVRLQVPAARTPSRRDSVRSDTINVGELVRLAERFGVHVGHRHPGLPTEDDVAILRVSGSEGRMWHWVVWDRGWYRDPNEPLSIWWRSQEAWLWGKLVAHYPTWRIR
jgi:hypothetical protein